jgi:hypothetical protein
MFSGTWQIEERHVGPAPAGNGWQIGPWTCVPGTYATHENAAAALRIWDDRRHAQAVGVIEAANGRGLAAPGWAIARVSEE